MIDIENQIAISERSSGWATITTVKPTQIRCPDLVNNSDKNLVFLGKWLKSRYNYCTNALYPSSELGMNKNGRK